MFDLLEKEAEYPQRARNAKDRAITEHPSVMMDGVDTYHVKSSKRFGGYYEVNFYTKNNRIFVDCECTAGRNEFPCKHVYAAKARRDSIRPNQSPEFSEASISFRITPRALVVNGYVSDEFATRTRIDHSRTLTNGEKFVQELQRLIRNAR